MNGRNARPPRRGRRETARVPHPDGTSGTRELAGFAAVESPPMDAGMWPAHPALWLHPEPAPRLPQSSGLCLERRNKAFPPEFSCSEGAPAEGNRALAEIRACPPSIGIGLPPSDLTPLGWNPRAAAGGAA